MWHPYSDASVVQRPLSAVNFSVWGMSYLKKQCLSHPSLLLLQQQPQFCEVLSLFQLVWQLPEEGAALCTSLSSAWVCFLPLGELWGDASLSWPWAGTHLELSLAVLMLSSIKWWAGFFAHAALLFTVTAMWLYANCCPLLGSSRGFCHQSYFSAASAFFWQSKWRFHLHCNLVFCLL